MWQNRSFGHSERVEDAEKNILRTYFLYVALPCEKQLAFAEQQRKLPYFLDSHPTLEYQEDNQVYETSFLTSVYLDQIVPHEGENREFSYLKKSAISDSGEA